VDLPDNRKSHSKDAALVIRAHRRMKGEICPVFLERVSDENGEPLGYRPLTNVELLGNQSQVSLGTGICPQLNRVMPSRTRRTVALEDETFPVPSTAKRKLKQIDFQFDGRKLRALEQNPNTKSRWAKIRDRKRN
jgi:hypothetical protein